MRKVKAFDCVELKRSLQDSRAQEFAGMDDQAILDRIHRDLQISEDPVAVWYRKVQAAQRNSRQS